MPNFTFADPGVSNTTTWLYPPECDSLVNTKDLVFQLEDLNGVDLTVENNPPKIQGKIQLKWVPETKPQFAEITVSHAAIVNPDRTQLWNAWTNFLVGLDELEPRNGVGKSFTIPGGAKAIAQAVAARLPLPLEEIPMYSLGMPFQSTHHKKYHYQDLLPGMRLKVSHGNFYDQSGSQVGDINSGYSGTGYTYINVKTNDVSTGLAFNAFMDIQNTSVASPKKIHSDARIAATVVDLSDAAGKPYHRLLYPPSAFLANNSPTLDLEERIVLESTSFYDDLSTNAEAYTGRIPTTFFGASDITAEIQVEVNGKLRFVPVGTTLRNILELDGQMSVRPASLKMSRYYKYELTEITFSTADHSQGLDLPLVQGDSVKWLISEDTGLEQRLQAIYNVTSSPTAEQLVESTIQSFGAIKPDLLPAENEMALALRTVKTVHGSYSPQDIATGVYQAYHSTSDDPQRLADLVIAMHFAGFDEVQVAWGLMSDTETGGVTANEMVAAFIESKVGYTVSQIATGVYDTMLNDTGIEAGELVTALIEGSALAHASFSSNDVAIGTISACGWGKTIAINNPLVDALIEGSYTADSSAQYSCETTSTALVAAYASIGVTLTNQEMVLALSKPTITSGTAYTIQEVAKATFRYNSKVTPSAPLSPSDVGTLFENAALGYSMKQVATAIYSIDDYTAENTRISPTKLATVLMNQYGNIHSNNDLSDRIGLALVHASTTVSNKSFTSLQVANAIYGAWKMGDHETGELLINMERVASAMNMCGFSYPSSPTDTSGSYAIYKQFPEAGPDDFATTIAWAYNPTVIPQQDVATLLGHFFPTSCNVSNATAMEGLVSALVYAFSDAAATGEHNTEYEDTAEAITKAFNIYNQTAYTQTNFNDMSMALVTVGLAHGILDEYQTVQIANALKGAFEGLADGQLAEALVHGFDFAETGADQSGINKVANAIAEADSYLDTGFEHDVTSVTDFAKVLIDAFNLEATQQDIIVIEKALLQTFTLIGFDELVHVLIQSFDLPTSSGGVPNQGSMNMIAEALKQHNLNPAKFAGIMAHFFKIDPTVQPNLNALAQASRVEGFDAFDTATGLKSLNNLITCKELAYALYAGYTDVKEGLSITPKKVADTITSIKGWSQSSTGFKMKVYDVALAIIHAFSLSSSSSSDVNNTISAMVSAFNVNANVNSDTGAEVFGETIDAFGLNETGQTTFTIKEYFSACASIYPKGQVDLAAVAEVVIAEFDIILDDFKKTSEVTSKIIDFGVSSPISSPSQLQSALKLVYKTLYKAFNIPAEFHDTVSFYPFLFRQIGFAATDSPDLSFNQFVTNIRTFAKPIVNEDVLGQLIILANAIYGWNKKFLDTNQQGFSELTGLYKHLYPDYTKYGKMGTGPQRQQKAVAQINACINSYVQFVGFAIPDVMVSQIITWLNKIYPIHTSKSFHESILSAIGESLAKTQGNIWTYAFYPYSSFSFVSKGLAQLSSNLSYEVDDSLLDGFVQILTAAFPYLLPSDLRALLIQYQDPGSGSAPFGPISDTQKFSTLSTFMAGTITQEQPGLAVSMAYALLCEPYPNPTSNLANDLGNVWPDQAGGPAISSAVQKVLGNDSTIFPMAQASISALQNHTNPIDFVPIFYKTANPNNRSLFEVISWTYRYHSMSIPVATTFGLICNKAYDFDPTLTGSGAWSLITDLVPVPPGDDGNSESAFKQVLTIPRD